MASTKRSSANEVTKMGSNCLILSWEPFVRTHTKPNLNLPHIVRHLRNSITERCMKFMENFASENPIFNKLLCLSTYFHNFSQFRCRNASNYHSLSNHQFAAILPGDSVAAIVVSNGLSNFLSIYNTLLVVRLVLTWFPNAPPAIVSPLSTLCDPYLNIFRGIIPPLGGTLDLSPILAFLVLNAFTSTAAALPAELPPTLSSQETPSHSHTEISDITTSQKKWMRRVSRSRPNGSNCAN